MRRSRSSERQVIGTLKAVQAWQKVADGCREHGVSRGTSYLWNPKNGGLGGRFVLSALLLLVWSGLARAQSRCSDCPTFPIPRAEAEFKELLEVPRGFAREGGPPIEQIFVNLMPYGPLDLEITGPATRDEISDLKNLYLGALSNILGVDPFRLTRVFNCGRECIDDRLDQIRPNLAAWSEVAAGFRSAKGVKLVGAWGAPVAFRVNDVIAAGAQVLVAEPSPVMGFIPGGRFHPQPSLDAALSERGIDSGQVRELLASMTRARAVAVRYRAAGGVEVVLIGVADNLSGVLFLDKGEPRPRDNLDHENGSRYVVVERIAKDTYFFETR